MEDHYPTPQLEEQLAELTIVDSVAPEDNPALSALVHCGKSHITAYILPPDDAAGEMGLS